MGPVSAVLEIVSKGIDKIFPDKSEAAKVKLRMLELEEEGQFKEIELKYQAIVEEARSSDPWTSRARPSFLYVMYLLVLGCVPVALGGVFYPEHMDLFVKGVKGWFEALPQELYWLFGSGYLGYGAYRSFDKGKVRDIGQRRDK